MRKILFKAKRIDNGEWVEGALFDGEKYCVIGQKIKFNPNIENECKIVGFTVDRNTICQYTGLTDKNGNKIWENDVVKKHFYTDYDACANSDEYVGFVKYEDFAWVIKSPKGKLIRTFPIIEAIAYSQDVKFFEVIGNIFDNPELLKEE